MYKISLDFDNLIIHYQKSIKIRMKHLIRNFDYSMSQRQKKALIKLTHRSFNTKWPSSDLHPDFYWYFHPSLDSDCRSPFVRIQT